MEEIKLKKYIHPLSNSVFILPFEKNPYMQEQSEDGFIFNDQVYDNPQTGEKDDTDQMVQCGIVVDAGPDCKQVKKGDHVLFNRYVLTPIPFMRKGFWMTGESGVLAIMDDEGEE